MAGCVGAPDAASRRRVTETYPVGDATRVEVRNRNGAVAVGSWDDGRVEVEATVRSLTGAGALDRVRIDAGVDDGTFRVDVTHRDGEFLRRPVVDLSVRVPSDLAVAHASTANGGLSVEGTVGDLLARSDNGAVEVRDVDGFVTAETANGAVEVREVAGLDGASASNGAVSVDVPALRDDATVSTSNGRIEARLAPDLDAELDCSAANGSVDVGGIELTDATLSRTRVAGRLGDGGHRLTLRAGNGSIAVRSL